MNKTSWILIGICFFGAVLTIISLFIPWFDIHVLMFHKSYQGIELSEPGIIFLVTAIINALAALTLGFFPKISRYIIMCCSTVGIILILLIVFKIYKTDFLKFISLKSMLNFQFGGLGAFFGYLITLAGAFLLQWMDADDQMTDNPEN